MQQQQAPSPPRRPTRSVSPPPDAGSSAPPPQPPARRETDGFLSILVTPKLSFALPRQTQWRSVDDISQEELRSAFLSRFPVQFDADRLIFQCAKPGLSLNESHGRLVYRICAEGVEDERVLLTILSELDRAYSASYAAALENARADCMSASMGFQVVADEVRRAQEQTALKWEAEVKGLREVQSKNQKRLFLLEQERDQLRDHLAKATSGFVSQNAALRQEMDSLRQELKEMHELKLALQQMAAGGGEGGAGRSRSAAPPTSSATETAATQTEAADDPRTVEHWQQQLSAVSEWLKTGAALLQDAPPPQA